MNDMTPTIIAKSDQLNADDFLSGPRTFTIERVEISPGTEQPVSIWLEGEERPWRSCKSMNRCLVAAWGPDANVYKGRSVTLFRDPTVKWGGMEVGGIRISHLSHIDSKLQLALTATRGKKAPFVVLPLASAPAVKPATDAAGKWAAAYIASVNGSADMAALDAFAESKAKKLEELKDKKPDLYAECVRALDAKRAALTPDDDDWGTDSSSDWPAETSEAEETIARLIAAADDKATWDAADEALTTRRAELSEEAAADLDRALAAKKAELTRRG